MVKRYLKPETYAMIGRPDIGNKAYILKNGKTKIWGIVTLLHFTGEHSKHKGKVEIGIEPFDKNWKERK